MGEFLRGVKRYAEMWRAGCGTPAWRCWTLDPVSISDHVYADDHAGLEEQRRAFLERRGEEPASSGRTPDGPENAPVMPELYIAAINQDQHLIDGRWSLPSNACPAVARRRQSAHLVPSPTRHAATLALEGAVGDQFKISFAGDPGLDATLNELAREFRAAGCLVVTDSSDVPAKGVELITAISVSLGAIATVRPIVMGILTLWAQRPRDRAFVLEAERNDVKMTVTLRTSGLDGSDYQATMASIAALLEGQGSDGA